MEAIDGCRGEKAKSPSGKGQKSWEGRRVSSSTGKSQHTTGIEEEKGKHEEVVWVVRRRKEIGNKGVKKHAPKGRGSRLNHGSERSSGEGGATAPIRRIRADRVEFGRLATKQRYRIGGNR